MHFHGNLSLSGSILRRLHGAVSDGLWMSIDQKKVENWFLIWKNS